MYKPKKIIPKAKFTRPELLTHPNIPKPLHGLNPRTILGQEWWDKQRNKAYKKNNYCCWACGVHKDLAKYKKWLEAHESYDYDWINGKLELQEIAALCHCCHNFIHSGRLQILQDKCQISERKFSDIMNHGLSILRKFPELLEAWDMRHAPGHFSNVTWKDWHIVIEGQKYFSKFENVEEWYEFYNK